MKKEITLDTKISELLNDYENMKEILIKINPKFKKLNNPILRRTIAKVAGVKQAAIVGGMDPIELVNQLRKAVGQEPIVEEKINVDIDDDIPNDILKLKEIIIDANQLLQEEKNPLTEVSKSLKKLKSDEVLVIKSDFKPEPLIDEFKKQNYKVYSKEIEKNIFKTYIKN